MPDETYYRKLTLTIISANDLQNVRTFVTSRVHARVTIGVGKDTEWRTSNDTLNGLNPAWNQMVDFDILESGINRNGLPLVIKLYSSRWVLPDLYIGEVYMMVRELFIRAENEGGIKNALISISRYPYYVICG